MAKEKEKKSPEATKSEKASVSTPSTVTGSSTETDKKKGAVISSTKVAGAKGIVKVVEDFGQKEKSMTMPLFSN